MKANATSAIPEVFAIDMWRMFAPLHKLLEALFVRNTQLYPNSVFLMATGEGEGQKGGEGRVYVVVCVRDRVSFFVSTVSDLRNCAATRSAEHVGLEDHFGAIAELALAVKMLSAPLYPATAQHSTSP